MSQAIKTTYPKDKTAAHNERKHIILLDGTWNDETGVNLDGLVTNIVNIQRILVNDEKHQIVRYHRGVGNDNDNGWLANKLKGATGRGVDKIVAHAYARFVQDWQKGDQIFIFGFSRGSAAARLLASKICMEDGNAIGEDLRHIGVQVDGDIDPEREPQIHQLYHDLCGSSDTYSVVTVKNGEGEKVDKPVKFQYRPLRD